MAILGARGVEVGRRRVQGSTCRNAKYTLAPMGDFEEDVDAERTTRTGPGASNRRRNDAALLAAAMRRTRCLERVMKSDLGPRRRA